jgi:hypothetical protein
MTSSENMALYERKKINNDRMNDFMLNLNYFSINIRRPLITVIPSKEEIHKHFSILDSRFHGNDINENFRDYHYVKIKKQHP